MQRRNAINSIHRQAIPVGLVADGELERGVDVSLLLVASDVQVGLPGTLVRETVDEPWVRVEVEDDGLVVCERGDPFPVRQAVRVVGVVDQLEQVHDVYEADLEVWEVFSEEGGSGQGFMRRDVAT